VVPVASDALLAWYALRTAPGLGPKRLVLVARELANRGLSGSTLLHAGVGDLEALGLPRRVAVAAAERLASPPPVSTVPPSVRILCPDDAEYPRRRLAEQLPLPVVMWAWGNLSLLKSPGIAIAGSRRTLPDVLDLVSELSTLLAKAGLNVVSGRAIGVDSAAHDAAIRYGTTTAVLAEGVMQWRGSAGEEASDDSVLVVSGFDPEASWTPGRAMERNAHIAALADAVVVVASGLNGGSWAQGQLCLKARKTLFVVDLPPDVAPGNAKLIAQGARPLPPEHLELVLDATALMENSPTQLKLLG